MSEAKVVLTLKGGTGYDEPWVVIHADSVDEASALLREVNDKGVFSGMKAAASVFHGAPTEAQAVSTVTAAFPGSTVTPPAPPAPAPSSVDPRCPDCGSAMTYKSGSSARGPWQGWFCVNKPKDAKGHVIWI